GNYLPTDLKEEVIDTKNTGYTGQQGLEELLKRSEDALKEAQITEEKKLLKRFFDELRSGGKVTYGIKEILRALKMGAVEILLISEDLEWEEIEYQCKNCEWSGKEFIKIEEKDDKVCPECGGELGIIGERDVFEAMEEKAENIGAETEVISKDTQEGKQFYQLGGIGAILRYRIS
ncbi:MAG: peptide chain release factor 1, partial [Candidatus Aenigmatarchaeota archaeon]